MYSYTLNPLGLPFFKGEYPPDSPPLIWKASPFVSTVLQKRCPGEREGFKQQWG